MAPNIGENFKQYDINLYLGVRYLDQKTTLTKRTCGAIDSGSYFVKANANNKY